MRDNSIVLPVHPAYVEPATLPTAVIRASLSGPPSPGDPVKAAKAIIAVALMSDPPFRLALGKDAVGSMRYKIESLQVSSHVRVVAPNCFLIVVAHSVIWHVTRRCRWIWILSKSCNFRDCECYNISCIFLSRTSASLCDCDTKLLLLNTLPISLDRPFLTSRAHSSRMLQRSEEIKGLLYGELSRPVPGLLTEDRAKIYHRYKHK